MQLKKFLGIFAVFAVIAMVSACETSTDSAGSAGGSGSAGQNAVKEGSGEHFVVSVGDRVFFGYDKYNLTPEARAQLDKQAAWLKSFPFRNVTVEGHCDERGTREYNLALGERRANAVKDYLVSLGIAPARIEVISYGKERPVALGSNEQAWSQNRRSVTVVKGAGS